MSTISGNNPSRKELAEQYLAQKAEKDEVKARHDAEMDNLKKSFNEEKAHLEDRFEQSTQQERISHYDQLRNTKRQMMKEQRQLENERRQVVGQSRDDLNKDALKTEQEGRDRINQVRTKYAQAEEYERNRAKEAQMLAGNAHRQSAEAIMNDSNEQIESFREQKNLEVDRSKQTHAESVSQIHEHYDGLRNKTESDYQTAFKDLQQRTTDDIDQRRLGAMITIHNYANRQADPFYNMKRFESTLEDSPSAYILKVKVPAYERDQFKVQVSGQEVRLSGVRASNEKAEVEPGRWVSSNSYQNVSERVALDVPVDGKAMSIKSNGEWMEYTIPKFGPDRRLSDQYKPQSLVNIEREDHMLTKELEFHKDLPKPTIPSKSKA